MCSSKTPKIPAVVPVIPPVETAAEQGTLSQKDFTVTPEGKVKQRQTGIKGLRIPTKPAVY
jgi:hypothetical protein